VEKLVFFTVFTSVSLLGYFFFTLEKKLPEIDQVKSTSEINNQLVNPTPNSVIQVTEDSMILENKNNSNKLTGVGKLKKERTISSVPAKDEPFVLDRSKLQKNLNMSEDELKSLSDAFERVIDKSKKAVK
jgi:hypothetical protein